MFKQLMLRFEIFVVTGRVAVKLGAVVRDWNMIKIMVLRPSKIIQLAKLHNNSSVTLLLDWARTRYRQ